MDRNWLTTSGGSPNSKLGCKQIQATGKINRHSPTPPSGEGTHPQVAVNDGVGVTGITGPRLASGYRSTLREAGGLRRESRMMSDRDVEWSSPDTSFKLRAAGIVIHQHHVLVCRADVIDGVFLPGGKVQFGESARAAIRREMHEEIGVRFEVDRPPLVVEAVREANGAIHQEVGFYFRLDWPEDLPREAANQVHHAEQSFEWIPVDELAERGFLPPEIISLIPGGEVVQHLAFDRRLPSE